MLPIVRLPCLNDHLVRHQLDGAPDDDPAEHGKRSARRGIDFSRKTRELSELCGVEQRLVDAFWTRFERDLLMEVCLRLVSRCRRLLLHGWLLDLAPCSGHDRQAAYHRRELRYYLASRRSMMLL